MSMDSVTGTLLTTKLTLSGQKNYTGSDYSPVTGSGSPQKTITFTVGGAIQDGINEIYSKITLITASANTSIDLTTVSDILNQSAINFARVKLIMLRLLSTTDDSTNGTAASSITVNNTVTNSLSSQSNSGWFSNAAEGAASGSKFTIANGDGLLWWTKRTAGVLVDGTHKVINIVNNDGAVTAAVQLTVLGSDT